ncbi:hypothetical protein [Burkholderia humptydooensis]|uniref:hypothetical protein n=1 Tax=Burkholderia humptydooensis TaxID=430531 RepID=UPI0003A01FF7|nr:hypothetical protein [Burkholderia humptydooensis]KST73684.1 hypothetical protein WS76_05535 [Burkholderia humptydooensis]
MTALPDASQPSSRRALPAVRTGFNAANVHVEPVGAVARSIAHLRAATSCAACRYAVRTRDARNEHDDRDDLDARATPAPMHRMSVTALGARSARVSRLSELKHSRTSIHPALRRASHATANAGCIALANPSGSSPAHRRAGTAVLQRRSVTILALRAEAEAASDSELSEAAPKYGSLGQPAGGHDLRRALRHGDALAHLIGIVQVVQIAGAVHATANVLVLRPPAGTLFDSGIHARSSATKRPLVATVKRASAHGSTFISPRRRVSRGATNIASRTAPPRGLERAGRASDAAASADARRIATMPDRACGTCDRRDAHRAACAPSIASASVSACRRRRSRDAQDVGNVAACRGAADLFHAGRAGVLAASSARRVATSAIDITETKTAGGAGATQDNHSPPPR